MGWRYIAQRIAGPNAGQFIDWDLPLRNVEITDAIGPAWFSATVSPEVQRLKGPDGNLLLDKWSTAIWAEESGVIRGGGILASNRFSGAEWRLECTGYAGYPQGIPYTGEYTAPAAGVDPLDVVRHIWDHVQSFPNGNLGVVVDDTTSPVRITPDQVQFSTTAGENVSFSEAPYRLAWYEAQDCGEEIASLAKTTPFDYRERHRWVDDSSDVIEHRLELGYPSLGRRRTDLRFVLGENIASMPSVEDNGDEYVNEVIGLGAGQGRTMVRTQTANGDPRLRRVYVYQDKSVKYISRLKPFIRNELVVRSGTLNINELTVHDHPNAPIGSWSPGDEILIQADVGWTEVALWCKVIETTIRPDAPEAASLKLERAVQ